MSSCLISCSSSSKLFHVVTYTIPKQILNVVCIFNNTYSNFLKHSSWLEPLQKSHLPRKTTFTSTFVIFLWLIHGIFGTFWDMRTLDLRNVCLQTYRNNSIRWKVAYFLRRIHTLQVNKSRILRIQNAKCSGYQFYMNSNIWRDYKICICVPLNVWAQTWQRYDLHFVIKEVLTDFKRFQRL